MSKCSRRPRLFVVISILMVTSLELLMKTQCSTRWCMMLNFLMGYQEFCIYHQISKILLINGLTIFINSISLRHNICKGLLIVFIIVKFFCWIKLFSLWFQGRRGNIIPSGSLMSASKSTRLLDPVSLFTVSSSDLNLLRVRLGTTCPF